MPHMENGVEVYRKSEVVRGQDAGKGDARRPRSVTENDFRKNWEWIFGKPARPGKKRGAATRHRKADTETRS